MAVRSPTQIYAYRSYRRNGRQHRVSMHRFILDAPPDRDVDHINHNGIDNRRSNLRICTTRQNCHNSRPVKKKRCAYKGVQVWVRAGRLRYRSVIHIGGKGYEIGAYHTAEEAAIVYNVAAQLCFGEFAYLNPV